MPPQKNTYHGATGKAASTEHFEVSVTRHAAGSHIPLHAHERPYLCFSLAGHYTEVSHRSAAIAPGTVLYRTADYEHENAFADHTGWCLNLEIKDPEALVLEGGVRLPEAEFQRGVSAGMAQLVTSLFHPVNSDLLDIQCYEALTSHLLDEHVLGKQNWVHQVATRIQDDPGQQVSLQALGREFDLHPNYLVRKFKAITGLTLSAFLAKTRVEAALQSLLQTRESCTAIALASGFYDQSHFNRTFKQHVGVSPAQFRRIARG